MKNLLLYNYNIDIDTYKCLENGISFYIDYDKYYFILINRVPQDIENIQNLLSNYINPYHFILKNKFGSFITENDKKYYALIKIKGAENDEIEIRDILNNQMSINENYSTLERNNWGVLWSEKVDYHEYQVSELGKNHPILLSSFSYYIGLAENAIEYFNLLDTKNEKLVVSKKRIKYPNISLNYFNPLNIVIDYKVRDIAEYLKSYFFQKEDVIDEFNSFILKDVLTPTEYNLLYARLLYPSYYFDNLTPILEENKNEEILLQYINKVDKYEKFLKETYLLLSKKCQMIKVDWIIKKEV